MCHLLGLARREKPLEHANAELLQFAKLRHSSVRAGACSWLARLLATCAFEGSMHALAPVSAALAADAAGEDEGMLQKIIFKAVVPRWRWQCVLFTVPAPDS